MTITIVHLQNNGAKDGLIEHARCMYAMLRYAMLRMYAMLRCIK